MERYNGAMVFVLLLLTAVIIGPLLYITTKDIVNPLRKLENSAQEIARGNLDFQLQSKSNNEIGSVIRSYEKMRCELKKSITRQLEMEENRKQLLSNITHDLKTPITSIKGYVQGIRDGVANDPAKLSRYLDVIYSKTEDMNAMIDDLFLFSKLDLGKEPFNKDDVELGEFYGNCVQELRLELDGRGVALAAEYHASEGRKVFMDSQKIKRVILNIVGNSLKFMDKDQKRLNLTFAEDSGNLVIKIRDNGIGIAREELDKIFDRFYRTDPSRNRNTGGSGLGLAIAWQIVEQHNGTIKAESEKGEWTEIAFSIPLNR
jgi:signal transduction histidine kinase